MKRLMGISSCCLAVYILFNGEISRADFFLWAAAKRIATPSAAKEHSSVSNVEEASKADTTGVEKPSHDDRLPNQIAESNGFFTPDVSPPPMNLGDASAELESETEKSESPFRHLLFVVLAIGVGGFVMIMAGIVQLWRRQRLKQIRLFSPAEISGLPFPVVAAADDELREGEKQAESRQDEGKEKTARRRVA